MKALILTAGMGQRIAKINSCRSKCLIPINGIPILTYKLRQIVADHLVSEIGIVVHETEHEIQAVYGDEFEGLPLVYFKQNSQSSGLVAAINAAMTWIEESGSEILLALGDEVIEHFDLRRFYNFFAKQPLQPLVLALPAEEETQIKRNYSLRLNEVQEIVEAVEKPSSVFNNLIGTGIVLFPKGFLSSVKSDLTLISQERQPQLVDYFDLALERGQAARCLVSDGRYRNINSAEDLRAAYRWLENPQQFDSITEQFSAIADAHPGQLAILAEDQNLTYQQVDQLTDQLATALLQSYPGDQSCGIALLCGRSSWQVLAMLATLKSGNFYVPLDENLPRERISYMLGKAGVRAAICLPGYEYLLPADCKPLILETKNGVTLRDKKTGEITSPVVLSRQQLASQRLQRTEGNCYIIFTSGSTGKPKGVLVTESAVLNLVQGIDEEIYATLSKDYLQIGVMASFSFDLSVQQIYPALLLGHTLTVIPADHKLRMDYLIQDLNRLDICDGTPLILSLLTSYLLQHPQEFTLSCYLSAGEELRKKTLHNFYQVSPNTIVWNCYGPTECTVETIICQVKSDQEKMMPTIPLGCPLPNTRVYVLDDKRCLLPPGVKGKLWIAGAGLSRGYINDPELSSAVFVPDILDPQEWMYDTGDLGLIKEDGKFYFLNRADRQLKHKGYRIEPGEIEKTLELLPDIKASRILLLSPEDQGLGNICGTPKTSLVAFYQTDKTTYTPAQLISHLQKSLPDYMLPEYFVPLTGFEVNQNGKLNRSALIKNWKKSLRSLPKQTKTVDLSLSQEDQDLANQLDICRTAIGGQPILADQSLRAAGYDSLMLIDLLIQLEDTFHIHLLAGELHNHLTGRELQTLIARKLSNKVQDQAAVNNQRMTTLATPMVQKLLSAEWRNKSLLQFSLINQMIYLIPLTRPLISGILASAFEETLCESDAFSLLFDFSPKHTRVRRGETHGGFREIAVANNALLDDREAMTALLPEMSVKSGPLINLFLLCAPQRQALLLAVHHAIFDYFSLQFYMRSLEKAYLRIENGSKSLVMSDLSDVPKILPYWDYLRQFNQYLKRRGGYANFWEDYLSDVDYIDIDKLMANLASKYPDLKREAISSSVLQAQTEEFRILTHPLSSELRQAISNYSQNSGFSVQTILLTTLLQVIESLLPTLNAPTILLFTAGRNQLAVRDAIGFYSHLINLTWSPSRDRDLPFIRRLSWLESHLHSLQQREDDYECANFSSEKQFQLNSQILFDYQKFFRAQLPDQAIWREMYPLETTGQGNAFSLRAYDFGQRLDLSFIYHNGQCRDEEIGLLASYYCMRLQENISR